MNSRLIAIVGGIGSGKSVVSHILRVLGYPVYDCDSRARTLMDNDTEIHQALLRHIHPEAVVNGKIDRSLISQIVFSDTEALLRLNTIVHGAVHTDLARWRSENRGTIFVETAIPVSSGLDKLVDQIWQVAAPEDLRIRRVQKRSNLTAHQIEARIQAQKAEEITSPHVILTNDGRHLLLPQILQNLKA